MRDRAGSVLDRVGSCGIVRDRCWIERDRAGLCGGVRGRGAGERGPAGRAIHACTKASQ